MALQEYPQALFKRTYMKLPPEAYSDSDVVERAIWLQLMQEPETLLSKG